MSGRRATVILLAAAVAAVAALALAALRGPQRPASVDERVDAVASTLRCPVCQNLSVADSPSGLAGEMRRTIERRLRAGDTAAEIRADFVSAYGEWILQAPEKEGISLVAWLAPPVTLLGGASLAAVAIRRWRRRRGAPRVAADDGLSAPDRALLDRAMAEEEVR
jgi:cytochrome c-type biogenesis protein CcmH